MQQFKPLCLQRAEEEGDTREVAAWLVKLSTKPRSIGSPPDTKTIGMDEVAAMAARVEVTPPPVATITVTLRRTKSAASAGS
jgi:hypothetical protein